MFDIASHKAGRYISSGTNFESSISIYVNQLDTIQVRQIGPIPTAIADTSPAIEDTTTGCASAAESPGLDSRAVAYRSRAKTRIGKACSHNQMSYACGRFWWLEFTSNLGLWHNCNACCTTRCEWNAKLRLALTWLNIPLAVTASFAFTRKNGRYDLRPALAIQHVVRNTSPGFEALFLCRFSHISVEEGKRRLRDLYRSDANFKHHVNPAGESYLRVRPSHRAIFLRRSALNFGRNSSVPIGPSRMISSSCWTSSLQKSAWTLAQRTQGEPSHVMY